MKRLNTPPIVRGETPWRSLGRTIRRSAVALSLIGIASLEAAPPELKTQGNQIVVKATGEPVRLTGVNIPSFDWGMGEDTVTTSLEVAVGSWKANVIRLPVGRSQWLGANSEVFRAKIDAFIARASELNVYVILDLHEYQDIEEADRTFWINAATRYKNNPAVLFGLVNEPHSISWEVWRNGDGTGYPSMQDLITAVRGTGAKNIVVAAGLQWGYTLWGILLYDHLLVDNTGNGIVYDSHIYPWKKDMQLQVGTMAEHHPVLIGEFGHPGGTTFEDHAPFQEHALWVPRWMDWINTHNLHWTGWCMYKGADPRMISDWSYTPSDHWGAYAKTHLKSYVDPDARRVVGGPVIGTTGTHSEPNSGVRTDPTRGAVAPFSGSDSAFFHAPAGVGAWTGLDLLKPYRITQIKFMPRQGNGHLMVGGVFQGSNSATFSSGVVNLHTVTSAPNHSAGVSTTVAVSDTGTYRYVRYLGADTHCNVGPIRFYTGTNSTPNVPDDVIVVDNGGPGTSMVGNWPESPTGGMHGKESVTDGAQGKGTSYYRFTPTLPEDGQYEVYVRWARHTNRSTNTPITVTYDGGTYQRTVDQTDATLGGIWNSFGTFAFKAGTTGNVTVSNTGTASNRYVSADAVIFARRYDTGGEVEVIVDNADSSGVTITGSWGTGTATGRWGEDYRHDNTGDGNKSVRFTPTLPSAGNYEVFARWAANENRTKYAPYTINYNGGSTTVPQDQEKNGGQWRSLGVFPFAAGTSGNVLLTNTGTTDGYVIADAVRFYKAAEAATEVILDSIAAADAPYVTKSSGWTSSNSTSGGYGSGGYYLHDGNDQGTKSVTFTPDLTGTGSYKVYLRWTSDQNRAEEVPVKIVHATGSDDTSVNQRYNGGTWYPVGTYSFNAGTGGSVTISTTDANGFVIADAVRFEPQ